jgi:hypothetical protein
LLAKLRSRWSLAPIAAIKLIRETTGVSLATARHALDRTVPQAHIDSINNLLDELLDMFVAEHTVESSTVEMAWRADRHRWSLELKGKPGSVWTDTDTDDSSQVAAARKEIETCN